MALRRVQGRREARCGNESDLRFVDHGEPLPSPFFNPLIVLSLDLPDKKEEAHAQEN